MGSPGCEVIRTRRDSISCLAITLIVAAFLSWLGLGLGMMGDVPAGVRRLPLYESAARVMLLTWLPAVALAWFLAPKPHRALVALVGIVATVVVYLVVGLAWWFRSDS